MDNILDLTNLNTKNVTNMNAMFKDCNNINEADISNIEMSSVTDASNMFSGCNNLTKLTMTGVDTSNVSNSTQLFDGCDNLKTIVIDNQTNLSGINSQIITNMNVRNIDEYFIEDERLLLKGSERITRELKVQGNIFGDSNHKAHLPNIKSSSIELGDGVVRKIDKNAVSGNVIYDAENEKFTTSNAVYDYVNERPYSKFLDVQYNEDCNNLTDPTIIYHTQSTAIIQTLGNRPTGYDGEMALITIPFGTEFSMQIYFAKAGNTHAVFRRVSSQGTWTSWVTF